tara:strand:- start:2548 stop:3045 length:498 start_codon:yes stop_codon:yes gene_type:complete
MQSPLLRFHSPGMQITESPGDSHRLQPVSSVMPDLAGDPRHRIAADAVAATGLKTLNSSDQPIAAFLHQIVAFTGTVVQQTVGTEMCQPEVHQHSVIALQDVLRDRSAAFMLSLTFKSSLNCRRLRGVGHRCHQAGTFSRSAESWLAHLTPVDERIHPQGGGMGR